MVFALKALRFAFELLESHKRTLLQGFSWPFFAIQSLWTGVHQVHEGVGAAAGDEGDAADGRGCSLPDVDTCGCYAFGEEERSHEEASHSLTYEDLGRLSLFMLEPPCRQALWTRCGSCAWVHVSGARGGLKPR